MRTSAPIHADVRTSPCGHPHQSMRTSAKMSADVRTDVRRLPRTSLRTTADLHMEILRASAQKKFPACEDLWTKRPNTPQTSAGKCPQFSMRNITFFADISGTGRSKLGCSLKKLMTEIFTAFGPSCVSYDTVRRWKKKFEFGVESIKNAPKSGRPKSASRKEIVSKIKEIIEGDARFTVRDYARKVGISLSTVHLILKKHLKVRKTSAR